MAGEQSAYTATGNPILITDTYMSDIADAIRAKTSSVDTYTPAQMAAAISAIQTGNNKNPLSFSAYGQHGTTAVMYNTYSSSVGPTFGSSYSSYIPDTRQIKFILGISRSYILLYLREAWLDYGQRTAYQNWGTIPLSCINLSASSLVYTPYYTNYSSPTVGQFCMKRASFENTNTSLAFPVYWTTSTGGTLGSAVSNSYGAWYWICNYDLKKNMPTE